ncbi:MAG: hypothetical protein H0X70_01205 [Segetibacter sp.]|jgi:hypothetical protein|nr:hypothetical protein [Segetibacter sp.]
MNYFSKTGSGVFYKGFYFIISVISKKLSKNDSADFVTLKKLLVRRPATAPTAAVGGLTNCNW